MMGSLGRAALGAVLLMAVLYGFIRADVARLDAVQRERARSGVLADQLAEHRRMQAQSLAVSANIEARGNDPVRGLLLAREALRYSPDGADGLTPENRALLWRSFLISRSTFLSEIGGGEVEFTGNYEPYITWSEGEEGRIFLGGRVYRFDVREDEGGRPEAVWKKLGFQAGDNALWMATSDPSRLLVQEGGEAWLVNLRRGEGRRLREPVFPPSSALLDSGHGLVLSYKLERPRPDRLATRATLHVRRADVTTDDVLSETASVVFESGDDGFIINVAAFVAAEDKIIVILSKSGPGRLYEIHALRPEFRDGQLRLTKDAVRKIPLDPLHLQPELHNAESVGMWLGTGHRFAEAVIDKDSSLFVFPDGDRSRIFDLKTLTERASCGRPDGPAVVRILDGGRAVAFAMSGDPQTSFFKDIISIRRPVKGCPEAARIRAEDRGTDFTGLYVIDLRAGGWGYYVLPTEEGGGTGNWIVPLTPDWAEDAPGREARDGSTADGGRIPTVWLARAPVAPGAFTTLLPGLRSHAGPIMAMAFRRPAAKGAFVPLLSLSATARGTAQFSLWSRPPPPSFHRPISVLTPPPELGAPHFATLVDGGEAPAAGVVGERGLGLLSLDGGGEKEVPAAARALLTWEDLGGISPRRRKETSGIDARLTGISSTGRFARVMHEKEDAVTIARLTGETPAQMILSFAESESGAPADPDPVTRIAVIGGDRYVLARTESGRFALADIRALFESGASEGGVRYIDPRPADQEQGENGDDPANAYFKAWSPGNSGLFFLLNERGLQVFDPEQKSEGPITEPFVDSALLRRLLHDDPTAAEVRAGDGSMVTQAPRINGFDTAAAGRFLAGTIVSGGSVFYSTLKLRPGRDLRGALTALDRVSGAGAPHFEEVRERYFERSGPHELPHVFGFSPIDIVPDWKKGGEAGVRHPDIVLLLDMKGASQLWRDGRPAGHSTRAWLEPGEQFFDELGLTVHLWPHPKDEESLIFVGPLDNRGKMGTSIGGRITAEQAAAGPPGLVNPYGKLALATREGKVRIVDLEPFTLAALAASAEATLPPHRRELSEDERLRFGIAPPPPAQPEERPAKVEPGALTRGWLALCTLIPDRTKEQCLAPFRWGPQGG